MSDKPNFSGSWNAVMERCRFRTEAPKALRMGIAHEDTRIRHKLLTVFNDGKERFAELNYVIGEETDADIGGVPARVIVSWNGVDLLIESCLEPQDQQLRLADHWSLSADGETLTMAHIDDALAGQICIFERAPLDEE